MIDALLLAFREAIQQASPTLGYGQANSGIMPDGRPPPPVGAVFLAIHEGDVSSESVENLDEYFAVSLTLTVRTTQVGRDQIGDRILLRKVANQIGFNARCDRLRKMMHNNWSAVSAANNWLIQLVGSTPSLIYGFCEPARYQGMSTPDFVTGDWFSASPDADDVGIMSQLSFARARRLQPCGAFT
jgi:hypothetical protein